MIGAFLKGNPVKCKPFVLILGAILVLTMISYDIIEAINGYFYIASLMEDIILAGIVTYIGFGVAKERPNSVLAGITLFIGYFAINYFIDMGWNIGDSLEELQESQTYLLVNIFGFLSYVAFIIGTFGFVLAKFEGYKKHSMVKLSTIGYLLYTLFYLTMIVTYVIIDNDLVRNISWYVFNFGYSLISIYLLAASAFSETVVYPSIRNTSVK